MAKFDAETIAREMLGGRWSALARTGLELEAVGRFDPSLVRETRVLVPIDVQALFVPAGSTEPMVRLPLALTGPEGGDPQPATPYLQDGPPRAAGVHLHWAMPDALLRGTLADRGQGNRLALPPLPDRWVVLRLLVPKGALQPAVRGWVVEADLGRVVPLTQWPAGAPAIEPTMRAVPRAELNGSAGGSLNWTGIYDAAINRFALHDPLDDLASLAPAGVEGEQIGYTVAGWWSDPALDPLDDAHTRSSLHEQLRQLGWALVEDREDNDKVHADRVVQMAKQASLGLTSATRYAPMVQTATRAAGPAAAAGGLVGVKAPLKAEVGLKPATSVLAGAAQSVVHTEPSWPRSTLLHGSVYGVPLRAGVGPDPRPAASALEPVWGEHGADVAATLVGASLEPADHKARREIERLFSAFTARLIDRVDSPDGMIDIEEWEHAAGFASRPGGDGGLDRLVEGAESGPLAAGRHARGMARAAALGAAGKGVQHTKVSFGRTRQQVKVHATQDEQREEMGQWGRTGKESQRERSEPGRSARSEPAVREVRRPAPRRFVPMEPVIAVRGVGRSLRHGGDGWASQDGRLQCRYPSQVITAIDQVVTGAELLPGLGSAAVPDEVLPLAREALLHNPWLASWIAAAAARLHALNAPATRKRMVAEAALRFGSTEAVYDGKSGAFSRAVKMVGARTRSQYDDRIGDQLRRFSLFRGVDPDPVGITAWSQPWVPMWLEWELALHLDDSLAGWQLGPVEYDPREGVALPPLLRTLQGRSLLSTGTAKTLSLSIRQWLKEEDERDTENRGEANPSTEAALARIATAVEQLDILSTNLDGLREQLLGLRYDGGLARVRDPVSGELGAPLANGQPPLWLRGGVLRLARARVVDAFGRTLELPLTKLRAPRRLAAPALATTPGDGLLLAPRLNLPARLMLRLVDPGVDGPAAPEANVDQVEPGRMVNPVAGFVLPDHIDEALEFFDAAGTPLGQLMHEPIGGGVVWEMAPGRDGPTDAGPLHDLQGAARHMGYLAAGTVTADAQARADPVQPAESALAAMLRAIDTTLWSVDALAAMGTEHIVGLVGRPIAVVRARLWLELQGEHGLPASAAQAALAGHAFTVRLGEITRSDDALLGYFVDDDYEHFHVVDKVVALHAVDSGRLRGQLAGLERAVQMPGTRPIEHRYVVAQDELSLRMGQAVTLTLLMHPLGKAHVTSGMLPRKSVQLAREWVAPGLAVMAPSARVGPVLIDPANVRLPKISAFPKDQLFTRRDSPGTWKDDPILAATQEALLPDLPHEVQEGYIRIAPAPAPGAKG